MNPELGLAAEKAESLPASSGKLVVITLVRLRILKIYPKNWASFQHYKDRSPAWVKLHRTLLDDMEFAGLSPEAGKMLPLLWLLASESDDGSVDDDSGRLSFRLRSPKDVISRCIAEIMAAGFFSTSQSEEDIVQRPRQADWGSRHISDKIKREIWIRDDGKCSRCNSRENVEYDHILPISKGGLSEPHNLQLLCIKCNRSKRVKTAEQFATQAQPQRSLEERRVEEEKEEKSAGKKIMATISDEERAEKVQKLNSLVSGIARK